MVSRSTSLLKDAAAIISPLGFLVLSRRFCSPSGPSIQIWVSVSMEERVGLGGGVKTNFSYHMKKSCTLSRLLLPFLTVLCYQGMESSPQSQHNHCHTHSITPISTPSLSHSQHHPDLNTITVTLTASPRSQHHHCHTHSITPISTPSLSHSQHHPDLNTITVTLIASP